MKKSMIGLLAIILSSSIFANTPIHTWHNVTSKQGHWQAALKPINQHARFVSEDGISALSTFTISPQKSQRYGFTFVEGDDFDLAYTLTLTQDDAKTFSSKACVFVVTAISPANPDVRILKYNGAKCEYRRVTHAGGDYFVS